ncbi:sensor histidine kinase [Streptomyces albireticuli]|uniref:sensor histidine kinase n=1 Tax=Streptomyces albireticuli TaxID=1940 RepID=UPI001E50E853|nr:histidine kinase [Streptomyces albireticuli]MCD9142902.1 histidine kinase [Streptomyces albireticuli]MCD9162779.1 histidine kinase [Streptomyces albireticuli]MCD9192339.1 histidine kinase [Streptomyces albireticuli]
MTAALPLLVPVLLAVVDALLVNGPGIGVDLGVSLLAAAALLLRRRFPVAVFLVTLPGIYIGYIWFAPMIALYTVATRRTDRRLLIGLALLLAAAHFVPYPLSDLSLSDRREVALQLVDACVTAATPVAVGLLTRTRRELAARLDELTRSRAREDRLLSEQVLATERARLAREMHDVVAHQVSLISLQAGALQIATPDERAREGARKIRELSVRTLEELRHMVGILRKAGADTEELSPQPRLADLPKMIEVSALDVTYENSYDPAVERPEAVERAAFRTVQEALTNARKHAPGAWVRVTVAEGDGPEGDGAEKDGAEGGGGAGTLLVEIRNGPADAATPVPGLPGGGHGLVGLRERAQSLGGTLEAHGTRDGGFVVRAGFPLAG